MTSIQQEYLKRLQRFHKVELVELKEGNPSFEDSKLIDEECTRILQNIKENELVIAFDVQSKMMDSLEFSQLINESITNQNVVIILGGSLGFNQELLNRAQVKLSMSPMTFPHLLARVMVLEQLYRSFKILNNQTYHK